MADIIEAIYADHDWFRRQFFLLDEARTAEELTAVWEPLATRLDTHAQAEETIFYPALLELGRHGDPEDETDDAVGDHNDIRAAVADSRRHPAGSPEWTEAVQRARKANGEHLEEEERESMPDFLKSASRDVRHELALAWARFWARHPEGEGIDTGPRDPQAYIDANS